MRKGRAIPYVASAVVATLAALWWLAGKPLVGPFEPVNGAPSRADDTSTTPPTGTPETTKDSALALVVDRPWQDLPPEAVITHPDCRLVAGTGSARAAAVAVVGTGEGPFWYAVVDREGVAFGGFVPFKPAEHVVLGRNLDGALLAAFRGSGDNWDEAWLVRDGQTIYHADEAWHFNLATDGTSFYSVEPLAGSASRLVIHNLDLRQEHHHDLGNTLRRTWASHRVAFSVSHDEVIVHPPGWPDGELKGTNRFYPVDGGLPREARTGDGSHAALFQSSETSYHVDYQAESVRLSRVDRRFDRTGHEIESDETWTREIQFDWHGRATLLPLMSDDGTRLIWATELFGMVLDMSSGETVISLPLDRENRDRYGDPTGVHFRDGRILLYRYQESVHGKPGGDRFVEIFDAGRANPRGIPDSRVRIESVPYKRFEGFALMDDPSGDPAPHPKHARGKTRCAEGALPDGRRLVAVEGRLTYRLASSPRNP